MAPTATTTIEEYQFPLKDLQSDNYFAIGNFDKHGAWKSKQLIGEALKSRVEAIDSDTCSVGEEDAFFIADLGEVYRQHLRWKKNLARVKPHYGEYIRYCLQEIVTNQPCSCQVQP
jgi:ornithine decarboxylase